MKRREKQEQTTTVMNLTEKKLSQEDDKEELKQQIARTRNIYPKPEWKWNSTYRISTRMATHPLVKKRCCSTMAACEQG